MNRLSRVVAVTAAAALVVPVWAGPASAASATETASSVAYFSSAGISKPVEQLPSNPPQLISDSAVDGVAPGNLGVGANAGQESKVSFAFFSLSDVPFGSTITKATLTLKLAPEDNGNRRMNALPKNVRACMPGDTGFGGQDGNSLRDEAPERKCDAFAAAATATPDGGAYVFDISGLAAGWAELNDGVALTRTADSDPNFQVVFTPDATLDYEFTPPADDLGTTTTDTGSVSTDLGGGFDAGSGATSFDAGGFSGGSVSSDLGGFGGAVASPLVGAELSGGAAPETAVDAPAVAAETRAAPAGVFESTTPTTGFWIAGLLLAAGLAFLSLVMGDPRPAAAASSARPSRLSQALSSARRGGSTPLLTTRS